MSSTFATTSSLRTKLVRTMIATLLAVCSTTLLVVAGMSYVSSRATLRKIEGHLRGEIAHRGTDLVNNQALGLRDLVADNAFSDVARLVERTVEKDEQVLYGLFLNDDLQPWGYARRSVDGSKVGAVQNAGTGAQDWRGLSIDAGTLRLPGVRTTSKTVDGHMVFEFAVPVIDDKGTFLGSLRYGLSDRTLQEALAEARAASRRALATAVALLLLLGLASSAFGVVLSRRAAARITRPLGALTEAVNALARGQRTTRVEIDSGDEIQLLGSAFNNMTSELADSYTRLEQMNRTLEAKVDERTRALAYRNRDMRLVLDNVDQGLLTLSASGLVGEERSNIVDSWFGAPAPGALYVDYIRRIDSAYAEAFELGYQALLEDVLPLDMCLSQLPPRLRHGGHEYQCNYTAIVVGERPEGILIVIKDVTVELQQARQEAEGKEMLALFNALAADRMRLLAFIDEVSELLTQLPGAELRVQQRVLHTIKGNAGVMDLSIVAGICHKLEDQIADTCAALPESAFAVLHQRWKELTDQVRVFLGEKGRDLVELSRRDLLQLDREIEAGASVTYVRDRLAALTLEPAERPLQHLGRHAQALALRLGKGSVQIVVDGGGVRLSPKRLEGVWAELVHVVRNAVDHGVEAEAERRRLGKPARATIGLRTAIADGNLTIEIEDDGAGIDWAAVRAAAVARGLPHETQDDLSAALFYDGLTTRAAVTALSGRGVGLAALRRQVDLQGGTVIVRSKPGAGTSFKLVFPVAAVGLRTGGVDIGIPSPVEATGHTGPVTGPVQAVA